MSERMPKVGAAIEARMGSSRLPGKVLMDVAGFPSLTRLLRRLRFAERVDEIILATSAGRADDVLAEWAASEGLAVHRGSEQDVLARMVEAHRAIDSELVVPVTGDCPLLDPAMIDWAVHVFLANDCDVVTTVGSNTLPLGMDVAVVRFRDLDEVCRSVDDRSVHEHTTSGLYSRPERYRTIRLVPPLHWWGEGLRFTLDYDVDLRFINEVYRSLEPEYGDAFGIGEMLELLARRPELAEINRLPSGGR